LTYNYFKPRPGSQRNPPPPYLQLTIFRRGGSQMGVTGLVQKLGEEGTRELLGCEWMLEE
jgi:hypothetical protein